MATIQKYFLCALMLNTICLSAMDLGIVLNTTDLSTINISQNNYTAMRKGNNETKKSDIQDDMLNLLTMKIDLKVERIRDKIDVNHLEIDKNGCFRHLRGSIKSYYKSTFLNKEKAENEIQKIESYLPNSTDRKDIFEILVKKHWYVHYVIRALVNETEQQIAEVKGSTIDKLCKPNFTNDHSGRKKMVYYQAYNRFNYPEQYNVPKEFTPLVRICWLAFLNSNSTRKELTALKNSQSLKEIDNSLRVYITEEIKEQIAQLSKNSKNKQY